MGQVIRQCTRAGLDQCPLIIQQGDTVTVSELSELPRVDRKGLRIVLHAVVSDGVSVQAQGLIAVTRRNALPVLAQKHRLRRAPDPSATAERNGPPPPSGP